MDQSGMPSKDADPEAAIDFEEMDRVHKQQLRALLVRITVYYALLGAFVIAIFALWPEAANRLPVGGISDLAGQQAVYDAALERAAQDTNLKRIEEIAAAAKAARAPQPWWSQGLSVLVAMAASFILMLPVAWTYKTIHRGHDYDHSIDETALLLPAIVTGIVAIVQHSLALAFSLAGIVAGVRFRRALNDTFDTLFIFVAIAAGLAAGVGAIEIAAVVTLFFNYATTLMSLTGDGLQSAHEARQKEEKRQRKLQQAQMTGLSEPDSPVG